MSNPDVDDSESALSQFVGGGTDDGDVPVPVYEIEQYLVDLEDADDRRQLFRNEFGYVRAFFRERANRYWRLQQRLNRARIGVLYDVYLTRSVAYASLAGIAGALVGLLITVLLGRFGVLAGVDAPAVSISDGLGGIVRFVSRNRVLVAGAAITLVLSLLSAAAVWLARLYYPAVLVGQRRRNIEVNLPHAIVYMYALSFGGTDFLKVIERMADAEETYGDISNEFDMIVRDIELFGSDLYTALRNARNLTPSDNLEAFLDDLLSVLDSGGDMTEFLHDQSEKYMDRAQTEQERFLDTLELLSEVFIVLFVAAPLLTVVVLMVMSFLGQNTIPHLTVIIYAVIPLVMVLFLLLIATLSEPFKQPNHDLDASDREADLSPDAEVRSTPGFRAFRAAQYRRWISNTVTSPLSVLVEHPLWTLFVTVPAAAAAVAVAPSVTGFPMAIETIRSRPTLGTIAYFVVPFLVVTVPLSGFHEYNRRRKDSIANKLPDALDILASANQMGIRLGKGIELVTRNLTGTFAEELRRTRNDIAWNHDVQNALRSLANRLNVPQLTRTCNILAEGARSTGELHRVLNIAAEDTRHRYRLNRDRQQDLNTYVAIVVVGFLVYLGVIVVLDQSFLGPIAEQATSSGSGTTGPVTINADALDLYHVLFFHSALIQATGTGAIAGKLTDNSVLSGLKYSILLVAISVGVFLVL